MSAKHFSSLHIKVSNRSGLTISSSTITDHSFLPKHRSNIRHLYTKARLKSFLKSSSSSSVTSKTPIISSDPVLALPILLPINSRSSLCSLRSNDTPLHVYHRPLLTHCHLSTYKTVYFVLSHSLSSHDSHLREKTLLWQCRPAWKTEYKQRIPCSTFIRAFCVGKWLLESVIWCAVLVSSLDSLLIFIFPSRQLVPKDPFQSPLV